MSLVAIQATGTASAHSASWLRPTPTSSARTITHRVPPLCYARRVLLVSTLLACSSGPPEGPPEVFFAPDTPAVIAITLPPSSRASLVEAPREYVRATVEIDGWRQRVGIRLKGRGSFRGIDSGEKPAFKIDFDRYAPGARFHGMRGLTLNNMASDPSLLAETACYAAFGAAGHATLQTRHARVTLDGEDLGVLLALEDTDRDYLERTFGDARGNQYEGTWAAQGGERVFADFTEAGVPVFEHDTAGLPADRADLLAFVADLDADPVRAVEEHVDLDGLLRFTALEVWTLHWDGYVGTRNNYRVYTGLEAGFQLVPWGCDDAMRHTALLRPTGFERPTGEPGRLWQLIQDDDVLREAWRATLLDLDATLASSTLLEDVARAADAIEADVEGSALDDAAPWASGRDWVLDTLATQPDRIAHLFD